MENGEVSEERVAINKKNENVERRKWKKQLIYLYGDYILEIIDDLYAKINNVSYLEIPCWLLEENCQFRYKNKYVYGYIDINSDHGAYNKK